MPQSESERPMRRPAPNEGSSGSWGASTLDQSEGPSGHFLASSVDSGAIQRLPSSRRSAAAVLDFGPERSRQHKPGLTPSPAPTRQSQRPRAPAFHRSAPSRRAPSSRRGSRSLSNHPTAVLEQAKGPHGGCVPCRQDEPARRHGTVVANATPALLQRCPEGRPRQGPGSGPYSLPCQGVPVGCKRKPYLSTLGSRSGGGRVEGLPAAELPTGLKTTALTTSSFAHRTLIVGLVQAQVKRRITWIPVCSLVSTVCSNAVGPDERPSSS